MMLLERWIAPLVIGIALLSAAWFGVVHYGNTRYQEGREKAIAERKAADDKAVAQREKENKEMAAKQAAAYEANQKVKDEEIATLKQRLAAAPRMRVGPSICPDRTTPSSNPESTASGDTADTSIGLVSERADADFKQLIEQVETDLATGRACQRFLRDNGLAD